MKQTLNYSLGNKISVVIPTRSRPQEVVELIVNLASQTLLPFEIIIVDGAPFEDKETQKIVSVQSKSIPFRCKYLRHGGGTAIQRNVGINAATGRFIAFIDDDIRLEENFFEQMLSVFDKDVSRHIGGIAGYITNQHLDPKTSPRWRWYRRLRLFATYEPGRYDFETGYPINRYLHPPHDGLRQIDFMGTNCAIWRKEVFESGLRFSEFFRGYAVLEDAHFALRAGEHWKLVENGRARCIHLRSQRGREDNRQVARKTAVNYRYVFVDLVPNRELKQELRFWRVQFFDLFRFIVHALRYGRKDSWSTVLGKIEGIIAAWRICRDLSCSHRERISSQAIEN